MKSYCIKLLLALYTIGNAQKPCAHLVAKGDNILYMGVDNVITMISDTKADSFTTTKGRVEGASATSCFVMVDSSAGSPCIVKVWSKGKVLAEKEYRIRQVPDPVPHLSRRGISLEFKNVDFAANAQVLEFTVVLMGEKGERTDVLNNGPAFITEARVLISKAERGDFLIFKNIKAKLPNGDEKVLDGMFIEITE